MSCVSGFVCDIHFLRFRGFLRYICHTCANSYSNASHYVSSCACLTRQLRLNVSTVRMTLAFGHDVNFDCHTYNMATKSWTHCLYKGTLLACIPICKCMEIHMHIQAVSALEIYCRYALSKHRNIYRENCLQTIEMVNCSFWHL